MIIMESPISIHVEQQAEFNCIVKVYKTYKTVAVVEELLLNQLTSPHTHPKHIHTHNTHTHMHATHT